MCPDQSQAFEEVNNSQAFTVGRKTNDPFLSGRAASRCSKACLYKVSRKYSKNWLRRTNIKSNLTPEIECTLKPSNYEAKPWLPHFTAQKSKCPRRFREMDPEILRTCSMCPCQAFYECFFSFSLEIWDPLRPKYPKKYKTQISGEKKKKRKIPIRKRLGRGTLNTCAKFQGLSLKNGVDIGLWRNLGFYASTNL